MNSLQQQARSPEMNDAQRAEPRPRQTRADAARAPWLGASLLLAVAACGGEDDGADPNVRTVAQDFAIPTAVAVDERNDVAWIAESQFDSFEPFNGDGMPGAFRIIGLSLNGNARPPEVPLPEDFFPEGITVTEVGRLYIGSVANGSIVTVAPGASEAVTFLPGANGSVLGLAADLERGLLWACVTDFSNSVLFAYGMADAEIRVQHPLPPGPNDSGALCNDVLVDDEGNVWVTESFGGRLFRIPANNALRESSAALWLEANELAGPNGPESGVFGVNGLELVNGRLYLANTDRDSLMSIDPTLPNPSGDDLETVVLTEIDDDDEVVAVRLSRPDGIGRRNDTELLLVENGLNRPTGKRLLSVRVDAL